MAGTETGEEVVEGMCSRLLWLQSRVPSRARVVLGSLWLWPKKTVQCSQRRQTRQGLCTARKEVCPGCGQTAAPLPPPRLLAQKEAAHPSQQPPRETAKRPPGPTPSILASHLTASLTPETIMCLVPPYAPCSRGWHPGLPARDGESHTKSPVGQAGLAGQRSEQTG